MCGIAGLVRLDGAPADRGQLAAMNARLAHRGPDGEGLWLDGPAGFAHRRLAIIDLATGDQPMVREDLGRAVIFNGEIYNYLELRAELLALGRTFKTQSDTEVLLVGHAQWGDGLLRRLRGMFALALWESGPRRLLLARDPLGKKPMQVAFLPGRLLAFGSEARALFALPEVTRRIEPEALAAYLTFLYVPEQQQMFRDVERLQAGEWLALEKGQVTRGRYAPDAHAEVPEAISFDDACARVDLALQQAVKLRLRSDVPLGVFLSGGVDSSLVALHAAAQVNGRLRTFTVGFAGKESQGDERPFARRVAEAIHAEHTELEVELDAPALALEVARSFDEPFGDSSAVPMLAMARETRRSVKVVLAGDGGDEIFGGYGSYLRHVRAGAAGPSPGALRRLAARGIGLARSAARGLPAPLAARIARLVRPFRRGLDAVADGGVKDPALRQLLLSRIAHSAPPEQLLRPLLHGALPSYAPLLAQVPQGLGALRAAMRVDRQLYLPGDILKKVDITAMRYALEVRAPLLDDELIALSDKLPEGFLVARLAGFTEERWGKRILKSLVSRSLGDQFAYRPKQGFGAPLLEWLRDPRFETLACDGFASARTPIAPWFTPGALARTWRDFRGGKEWLAQEVWNLIQLDAWARETGPT